MAPEGVALRKPRPQPADSPTPEVDLNQIVAYNVRAARDLRRWTQEELADRLEPYLGQRISQAPLIDDQFRGAEEGSAVADMVVRRRPPAWP